MTGEHVDSKTPLQYCQAPGAPLLLGLEEGESPFSWMPREDFIGETAFELCVARSPCS